MISFLFPLLWVSGQAEGKAALDAWQSKMVSSKTMIGSLKIEAMDLSDTIQFELKKPHLGRVTSKDAIRLCDGNSSVTYFKERNAYTQDEGDLRFPYVSSLFYGCERFVGADENFDYAGESASQFDSVDAWAVTMKQKPATTIIIGQVVKNSSPIGFGGGFQITLFFSKADRKLLGYEADLPMCKLKGTYIDLKFDQGMTAKSFAFKPPTGATKEPSNALDAQLLPVGSKAPDFTLKTFDGKTIKLSQYVKGKKATLVNFWFYGCSGCMVEYPHLEKLYQQFKVKGLGLVGATPIDTPDVVAKYYKEGKFSFPCVVSNGTSVDLQKMYRLRAYPTNYIIDSNMKILYRKVGEYQNLIEAELTKTGIQ